LQNPSAGKVLKVLSRFLYFFGKKFIRGLKNAIFEPFLTGHWQEKFSCCLTSGNNPKKVSNEN
jgi:hypothetical protein